MQFDGVAVTGLGVVSSIGFTKDAFWKNLVEGTSGIEAIKSFDASGHKSRIASEAFDFKPETLLNPKQARRMARVSQFAVWAATSAVKDAGLEPAVMDTSRVCCIVGSAAGDYHNLEEQFIRFHEKGPGSVNALTIPKVIPNMPACNVGISLGIRGPNLGIATACATGTHALGIALSLLRGGWADVVIAGGAESTITPFVVDGYASMGVLSRRNAEPHRASRPFDADRDGFVIGEGAGILVLETIPHAKKRGAEILALFKGFGMSCDAHNIAIPEPDGAAASAAILNAIGDAGLNPEDIGYINAHGTSTKVNDRVETNAIVRAFGEHSKKVRVSSIKSMIGHTLGAAGAIEAAATVLTLRHGIAPPNINYETKDPECDLNIVANEAQEADLNAAISNSFGFGGQNATVVFTKN